VNGIALLRQFKHLLLLPFLSQTLLYKQP